MPNRPVDPPERDEIEISLLGPGYGEAIVLHIGDGKWIIIDSCVWPGSRRPAPLQYLDDLNVNVADAVKLVVATHWHDDHVRGISLVCDECLSADFAIPNALTVPQFLTLVALYLEPTSPTDSGLTEFSKVFRLLQERKQRRVRFNTPKHAAADRRLYRDQIWVDSRFVEAQVHALSPSDASMMQAQLAFARLWPEEGDPKKRIPSPNANCSSVVLWVEVDTHKILFGADLQNTKDPRTGWSAILNHSSTAIGKAGVFKIPHHGSQNAHNATVWSQLLQKEPYAILSPFHRGNTHLPSPEDAERIAKLTSHGYATAPTTPRSAKWRNRVVREFMSLQTRKVISHSRGGQVRLRKKIRDLTPSWRVELFGDACRLDASWS